MFDWVLNTPLLSLQNEMKLSFKQLFVKCVLKDHFVYQFLITTLDFFVLKPFLKKKDLLEAYLRDREEKLYVI